MIDLSLETLAWLEAMNSKPFHTLSIQDQLKLLQDQTFPEQNAFVLDEHRYLAALCTRRAGKSNGLAYRFKRTMAKHPGCLAVYIALTRESARNIMWDILQEQDDKFKIGSQFTESDLTMTMPNGSRLQLFGADMKNFINRLKGIKTPGAAIDEAQNFGTHIRELVDDVLTPTILDYNDGWLALTGTPGPIPLGLFYEITDQRKYGYSVHHWSLFNNPYLPTAKDFVLDLIQKKNWALDHPTYLREWCGKWVLDIDALVFKYDASRNHYDQMPHLNGWEYVLGIDIGLHDADAIAVLGWNPKLKEVYLIEELVKPRQGITELVHQIQGFIEKYDPNKIVMDTGGLGAKIAEEMRRRYQLPIEAAEKTRKFEYIELLNDAMRTRKFYARSDSRFAEDCQLIKWDTDVASEKLKISDNYHSDINDAVLYAFRECLHWLYEPEAPLIKPGTNEWMKKQEVLMEQAAEELMQQKNQRDDLWNYGDGWS